MSDSANDTAETKVEKSAPRRKLGRGLGALMGEMRREEPISQGEKQNKSEAQLTVASTANKGQGVPTGGLANLTIASIEPHPDQPRRHFDEEALEELAASIRARGVIQPIIVRPRPGGTYQLIAGERRWRAAQKAQVHEIPALIRDLDDREVMALALIENIQREDLNPVEEARAYQRLSQVEELTQAEIARLVDKSRSHVANLQRLLSLPEEVLDHLESARLDMGHARALIGRDDAATLAQQAVDQKLSVREVEKLARKGTEPARQRRRAAEPRDAGGNEDILAVQAQLEEFLGLSVKITADADPKSGNVTIRYRTLDQLDLICQRLTGGAF